MLFMRKKTAVVYFHNKQKKISERNQQRPELCMQVVFIQNMVSTGVGLAMEPERK